MKPIWQSKTFWFNILTTVAALLASPEIAAFLGPNGMQYIVVAQTALNIILRLLSKDAVSLTGQ